MLARSAVGAVAPPIRWILPSSATAAAAAPRQRADGGPTVGLHIIGIGVVIGVAVLLDEAAEGVNAPLQRHHGGVVGAARQRRGVVPAVRGGVVDMVVAA